MNQFEELKELYQKEGLRNQQYHFQSVEVVAQFRSALIKHLGCNEMVVLLQPVLEKRDAARSIFSPFDALELDDRGYWNFGVRVDLDATHLLQRFLLKGNITAGKLDGSFMLKVNADDAPCFQISPVERDYRPIVQWSVQRMKDYGENALERYLSKGSDANRRMGFLA